MAIAVEYDGFYVSYTDGREPNMWDGLGVILGQINPVNLNRPETALVYPCDQQSFGRRYLILYGDYREAYAKIANQGLQACIDLFEKHIEHIGDTSDLPLRTNATN